MAEWCRCEGVSRKRVGRRKWGRRFESCVARRARKSETEGVAGSCARGVAGVVAGSVSPSN
eukprot:4384245-Alexandrium_andersonii.AAC.1